jgi:hypothetical protein
MIVVFKGSQVTKENWGAFRGKIYKCNMMPLWLTQRFFSGREQICVVGGPYYDTHCGRFGHGSQLEI